MMTGENQLPGLIAPSSRTLSDQVARQLRQAIIVGRLRPGQRIVEQEVAEAMKTSRGPVREALRRLINERLVIIHPHRGTFVAGLSAADAEEIYSFRQAIEGLAVAHAVKRATDEQIAELDELVKAMMKRTKGEYDEVDATEIDLEFHHVLCRISGHSRVLHAWEAMSGEIRMLLLSHRTLKPYDFAEKAVEWHAAVVEALRQRNTRAACKLMRRHLASSFLTVSQALAAEERLDNPSHKSGRGRASKSRGNTAQRLTE